MVCALHRKAIAIPGDNIANPLLVLVHEANRKLSLPPAKPEACFTFHSSFSLLSCSFQTLHSKSNTQKVSIQKEKPEAKYISTFYIFSYYEEMEVPHICDIWNCDSTV